MSVSETNFEILKPNLFISLWFSENINALGLRFEIRLCKQNGRLFLASKPYPFGTINLLIFRDQLRDKLKPYKMLFADRGYPVVWLLPHIRERLTAHFIDVCTHHM